MGCIAHAVVVADDPTALLDHAGHRLDELERRWSRFLDDSEISGLNRAGGMPRRCSQDTVALVGALTSAWHATDGAFDPTLLPTLVELGYAASRVDATRRTSLAAGAHPIGRADQVLVDPASGVVRLPTGTTLDPGGLGKGLAADLVVRELVHAGAVGALVEIGGDLRVAGRSPTGAAWPIEVRAPTGGPSDVVHLTAGGVATSSSRRRTWDSDAGPRHHLLSPRTGRPTDDDVIGCTVIAGTAAGAEAFTKVAFVDGCEPALATYERVGLAARVTTGDGRAHHSRSWAAFAA
jgi:thiamine biosynthesis lipoprotein